MKRDVLFLESLMPLGDLSILGLRLLTGSFLVWEMWFNISDAATMEAVVAYFGKNGFAYPGIFAPLSAWAQFGIGIGLVLGLLTRWAGLLLAFNFIIGIVMVHWHESYREWWPAIVLVGLGLHFAAVGGGRFSLDAVLLRRGRAETGTIAR